METRCNLAEERMTWFEIETDKCSSMQRVITRSNSRHRINRVGVGRLRILLDNSGDSKQSARDVARDPHFVRIFTFSSSKFFFFLFFFSVEFQVCVSISFVVRQLPIRMKRRKEKKERRRRRRKVDRLEIFG